MLVKLRCNICHTTFKVGVVGPVPIKAPYRDCPYGCKASDGIADITIDQFTTEEYAFETLAESFGMSVDLFKSFYDSWSHTPNSPRLLKEYIISQLEQLSNQSLKGA